MSIVAIPTGNHKINQLTHTSSNSLANLFQCGNLDEPGNFAHSHQEAVTVMQTVIPDCFPAQRYRWILSSCIRIKNSVFHVHFDTKHEYDELLNNPYEMARRAKDKGCNRIFLYIVGSDTPKLRLDAEGIIKLGDRLKGLGLLDEH